MWGIGVVAERKPGPDGDTAIKPAAAWTRFTTPGMSTAVQRGSGAEDGEEIALPLGRSIFPAAVAASDGWGYSRAQQWGTVALTAVVVFGLLPLVPSLPADTSWDALHHVSPSPRTVGDIAILLEQSLGLAPPTQLQLLLCSIAPFLALFCLDEGLGCSWHRVLPSGLHSAIFKGSGSTACYKKMFCEYSAVGAARARAGRMASAPGNTYSNVLYLFAGVCVLASTLGPASAGAGTAFWLPDAIYGTVVVCLSVCSTGWHATNRPCFHYPDLFFMECAILYHIIRVPCTAVASPTAALGLYLAAIALNGKHKWDWYTAGHLDHACPFAGRYRVFHNGQEGNEDLGVGGICVFAMLPVLYLVIPCAVQIFVLGNAGSVAAYSLAINALVVGWSYRMLEQFCLDGCGPMALIERVTPAGTGATRTAMAAVVSPTCWLHLTTGATLLLAYAGGRTLEAQGH